MAVKAQWTPRYPAHLHAVPLQLLLLRLHTENLAVMLDEVCALCILRPYGNEYTPLPSARPP